MKPDIPGPDEYVLAITVPTSRFLQKIRAPGPEPWLIEVADRHNVYITHSTRHDEVTGKAGVSSYLGGNSGGSRFFLCQQRSRSSPARRIQTIGPHGMADNCEYPGGGD